MSGKKYLVYRVGVQEVYKKQAQKPEPLSLSYGNYLVPGAGIEPAWT